MGPCSRRVRFGWNVWFRLLRSLGSRPENASGAVQRDATMGGGRDGCDSRHARRDATAEIFETEKGADGAGDVHEQRRTTLKMKAIKQVWRFLLNQIVQVHYSKH